MTKLCVKWDSEGSPAWPCKVGDLDAAHTSTITEGSLLAYTAPRL